MKWVRPGEYYIETPGYTVCKVSVMGEVRYEAWSRPVEKAQPSKRIGWSLSPDEAKAICEQHATARRGG